jgi:hypothetical protein
MPTPDPTTKPNSDAVAPAGRAPTLDALPVEAQTRTEDLERTQSAQDQATEEAEDAQETARARQQESEPGKGENAAGFLHPTRR